MAELRANAEIWTYQDIVEHILDVYDNTRTGRPLRVARRAAREALRELHMSHRWSYYDSTGLIRTEATQSSGTITYDHTGGSSERLVTLASDTWPTNAKYYKIIISDVHYPIDTYESTTTLTLPADNNPGADVSSGTSYTLYRESYPLPIGMAEFGNLIDVTNNRVVPVVSTDIQVTRKHLVYDTPDTPWHVSLRNDGDFLNSLSLVFSPPPSSAREYRFTYQRAPRALTTELYNTGTVTAVSGTTSVSVTTGSLSAKHIGSVIRFGDASDAPTNVFGGIDDSDTPFTDQAVILDIGDGTALTIDQPVSMAYTTVKYTVSDPIDIENNTMLTALQRLCESKYSIMTKREIKDRRDRGELAAIAVALAKERDNKSLYSPVYAPYDPFSRVTPTDDA